MNIEKHKIGKIEVSFLPTHLVNLCPSPLLHSISQPIDSFLGILSEMFYVYSEYIWKAAKIPAMEF